MEDVFKRLLKFTNGYLLVKLKNKYILMYILKFFSFWKDSVTTEFCDLNRKK